jgi:hypothetical protein
MLQHLLGQPIGNGAPLPYTVDQNFLAVALATQQPGGSPGGE